MITWYIKSSNFSIYVPAIEARRYRVELHVPPADPKCSFGKTGVSHRKIQAEVHPMACTRSTTQAFALKGIGKAEALHDLRQYKTDKENHFHVVCHKTYGGSFL